MLLSFIHLAPHRDTINVGWDGRVFDCDFNQQLGLGMGMAGTNAGASEKLRAVKVGFSSLFRSVSRATACLEPIQESPTILSQLLFWAPLFASVRQRRVHFPSDSFGLGTEIPHGRNSVLFRVNINNFWISNVSFS